MDYGDLRLQRGFTVEEALQMVYEDDLDVRNIFIEPPEANVLNDEDSGDEEEGGSVDNLSGQQLLAGAELRVDQAINGEPDEPVQDNEGPFTRPGQEKITWMKKGDILPNKKAFPEPNYSRFKNLADVKIFEQFIDQETVEVFVEQSTIYAVFLNHSDPKISSGEMKCAIAIIILSGYHELPGEDMEYRKGLERTHCVRCHGKRSV
ncbi:hypothetical protein JTB14_022436 [Gonioctena quinquepunctata]|nr:hypothetical protein JTB14_022436 [Gonioctena quinquepunctata]